MTTNTRTQYWCGTLNNYTDEEVDKCKDGCALYCFYAVIGREVGENNTPHLQAYFEFKTSVRMTRVKSILGCERWHLEKRRGTAIQAADYCKKDGAFSEMGEISKPEPGKRTDLEVVRSKIDSNEIRNFSQLLQTVRSTAAITFGEKYLALKKRPFMREAPTVFWIHGKTGAGKSFAVGEFIWKMELNGCTHWRSGDVVKLKWFDAYDVDDIAVFDDFRWNGKEETFVKLLSLMDRYSLRVEIKGGWVHWEPKYILITCDQDIRTVFQEYRGDVGQLERRVTKVFNFNVETEKRAFSELIDTFVIRNDEDVENGTEEKKEREPHTPSEEAVLSTPQPDIRRVKKRRREYDTPSSSEVRKNLATMFQKHIRDEDLSSARSSQCSIDTECVVDEDDDRSVISV